MTEQPDTETEDTSGLTPENSRSSSKSIENGKTMSRSHKPNTSVEEIMSRTDWLKFAYQKTIDALKDLKRQEFTLLVTFVYSHEGQIRQCNSFSQSVINGINEVNRGTNIRTVVRSPIIVGIINKEIATQLDNEGDFDNETLASLGQKVSALGVVFGRVIPANGHFSVEVRTIDVSKASPIPGSGFSKEIMDINDICTRLTSAKIESMFRNGLAQFETDANAGFEQIEKARAYDPGNAVFELVTAYALRDMERHTDARARFQSAIELARRNGKRQIESEGQIALELYE